MKNENKEKLEVLTFVGEACSGKTTLAEKFINEHPDKFALPIGITTRMPRNHEVPGVDYIFLSKEEFKELIDKKELIAHIEYCGNFYGTLIKDIENINRENKIALFMATEEMVELSRKNMGDNLNMTSIYLDIPVNTLIERLNQRLIKEINHILDTSESSSIKLGKIEKNMEDLDGRVYRIQNKFGKIPKDAYILNQEDIEKIHEDPEMIKYLFDKIKIKREVNVNILALVGRSAAGKSMLASELREKYGFQEAVSCTSRPMREGEVNGQSYNFFTKEEFLEKIKNNEFVETVEFNGHYYGLHRDEILRISQLGSPILAVVEPNGLSQIAAYSINQNIKNINNYLGKVWNVSSVWINAPDNIIFQRLVERYKKDYKNLKTIEEKIKVLKTFGDRWISSNTVEKEWEYKANKDFEILEFYTSKHIKGFDFDSYIDSLDSYPKTSEDIFKTFADTWLKMAYETSLANNDLIEVKIGRDDFSDYEIKVNNFDDSLSPNVFNKTLNKINEIYGKESLAKNLSKDEIVKKSLLSAMKK